MNNQDKQELVVKYKIDDNEIQLTPSIVQEYLVGSSAKITKAEFRMFTELCKFRKLNPFLKEVHLIKYKEGEPASIVVGKDAIIKRAVLHPQFNGMKSGIIVLTEDGEEKRRVGAFKLPNERLAGAWCEVFRKDWANSLEASVSYAEAVQKKYDGTPNKNWSKQPATMLEKVAKVRALREAFVEDLQGMYSEEEMSIEHGESKTAQETQSEPIIQEEPTETEAVKEAVYEELSMNEL